MTCRKYFDLKWTYICVLCLSPKTSDNSLFHASGGLVALVAHNKMKGQMASFVEQNVDFFKHCRIITTGSTGKTLEGKLGLEVHQKVASGPLGGDQEIGALVTQGKYLQQRYSTMTCS